MPGLTAKRLQRYLDILPALFRHSGVTVDAMCRRTGLTRRELDEALRTLSLCGLPPYDPGSLIDAYIEGGRVYALYSEEVFKRPVRLTREEAAALWLAGQVSLAGPKPVLDTDARAALDKVRAALRPDAAASADAVERRFRIEPETGGMLPVLHTLQRAVRQRVKVDVEYYTAGRRDLTCRRLRPYGLIYYIANWYLVAWCEMREGERLFRVDNIKSSALTEESFAPPKHFDLEKFKARRMFQTIRREHEVTMRFLPPAAELAAARRPGRARRRDGAAGVSFLVDRLENFLPTVLSYGENVVVESPESLRALARDTAKSLLKKYSPG